MKQIVLVILAAFMSIQCSTSNNDSTDKQPLKVDFDFDGRKLVEVHEPEYHSWVIGETNSFQKKIENIQFSVSGELQTNWDKTGVQAPYYARLVNDGLVAEKKLTLKIEGLAEGSHSLLTFHNSLSGEKEKDESAISILINGEKVQSVQPTYKAKSTIKSSMTYLQFQVGESGTVEIQFLGEQPIVNGFELNGENMLKQARTPFPEHLDEHVPIDKNFTLAWDSPKDIQSHQLYFGTDDKAIRTATKDSELYKGELDKNSFAVSDLYSMEHYYWRVDEVYENGETVKGEVWEFKPAQLAFPEAEGYGRYAIGGRGGKVVEVTNLNDSGPGSLRHAIEKIEGPRTIVFRVSGEIKLKDRIIANDKYLTIAGQTAPGKGIVITEAPIGLTGDDGMMQFMRVRLGAGRTFDGMGLTGANHSIVDHCSISWTIDEGFSSRGAQNITLQRTLISEALNVAGHDHYEEGSMHGYAATIGGEVGSFHHNLLAHNFGRNWSLGGGVDGDGYYWSKMDIRNNVVYNWGHRTTDGGANEVNFVGNYYKPGPATTFFYALNAQHEAYGKGKQQYYFADNVMPGHFGLQNQEDGRTMEISDNAVVDYETYLDKPFFKSYVTTHSAREAYKNVLSDVGANVSLDNHDQRMIRETLDSTYTYMGEKSELGGMIDTEKDVGGLENYPKETRSEDWDTDHDGLPNWWEEAKDLNPQSDDGDFSESNADEDKNGYTQLEEYLHWISEPHYNINSGEEVSFSVEELFKGFRNSPKYDVDSKENLDASIEDGELSFSSKEKGFAQLTLSVEDAAGHTMKRKVMVFVK